jgi:hypothetical protein
MAILVFVMILALIGFVVWGIIRVVKNKGIKAHNIAYVLAILSGIVTYGYILSLDFPILIKIMASIFLGVILIIWGALNERRRTANKSN